MITDLTKSSEASFDFDLKHEMERTGLSRDCVLHYGYYQYKRNNPPVKKMTPMELEAELQKLEQQCETFRPHYNIEKKRLGRELTRQEHKRLWDSIFNNQN